MSVKIYATAAISVILEIYESEMTYYQSLEKFNRLWIQKTLVKHARFCKSALYALDHPKVAGAFTCISQISQLSYDFVTAMKSIIQDVTREDLAKIKLADIELSVTQSKILIARIGVILMQFAPYFAVYSDYATDFPEAQTVLNDLTSGTGIAGKINKAAAKVGLKQISSKLDQDGKIQLQKALQELQDSKENQNQTMGSYLILPIQRIPRYILLLKELLKKISSNEELCRMKIGDLDFRKVINQSNDESAKLEHSKSRNWNSLKKVNQEQKQFHENDDVKSEAVVSKSEEKDEGQEVNIIQQIGISLDIFQEIASLINHSVQRKISDSSYNENDHDDQSEKLAMLEMSDLLQQVAPVWTAESDSNALKGSMSDTIDIKKDRPQIRCEICSGVFGILTFRFKHHCRNCGKLICGDCSTLYGNEQKRRLCKPCSTNSVSNNYVVSQKFVITSGIHSKYLCGPWNPVMLDPKKCSKCFEIVDSFANFCPSCGIAKTEIVDDMALRNLWAFFQEEDSYQSYLKDFVIKHFTSLILKSIDNYDRETASKKGSDSPVLSKYLGNLVSYFVSLNLLQKVHQGFVNELKQGIEDWALEKVLCQGMQISTIFLNAFHKFNQQFNIYLTLAKNMSYVLYRFKHDEFLKFASRDLPGISFEVFLTKFHEEIIAKFTYYRTAFETMAQLLPIEEKVLMQLASMMQDCQKDIQKQRKRGDALPELFRAQALFDDQQDEFLPFLDFGDGNIVPTKRFIKFSEILKNSTIGIEKVTFHLFSDCVIFSEKSDEGKLKVKSLYPLDDIMLKISDIKQIKHKEWDNSSSLEFIISSESKSILLCFQNKENLSNWVKLIDTAKHDWTSWFQFLPDDNEKSKWHLALYKNPAISVIEKSMIRRSEKLRCSSISSFNDDDISLSQLMKNVFECRKCGYKGICRFCINCGRLMKD
jgi:hypothetical protein